MDSSAAETAVAPLGARILVNTIPRLDSGIIALPDSPWRRDVEGIVMAVGREFLTDEDYEGIQAPASSSLVAGARVILRPMAGQLVEEKKDGSAIRLVLKSDVVCVVELEEGWPRLEPIPGLWVRGLDDHPERKE